MKKFIAPAIAALTISALSGCETTTQAYNMSQKGSDAYSCEEVGKAFNAYKRDRTSEDGLAVLVPIIANAGGIDTQSAGTTSDAYYEQAKSAANMYMLLQGCPTIQ